MPSKFGNRAVDLELVGGQMFVAKGSRKCPNERALIVSQNVFEEVLDEVWFEVSQVKAGIIVRSVC